MKYVTRKASVKEARTLLQCLNLDRNRHEYVTLLPDRSTHDYEETQLGQNASNALFSTNLRDFQDVHAIEPLML